MLRYLGVILLLLTTAMAPAAASQDFLVVPGVRLGPISLGMSLHELEDSLGSPDDHIAGNVYRWQQHFSGAPLIVILDGKRRVSKIKIYWDTFYQTSDGLHVGMLEGDIYATLGAPRTMRKWSHFKALYYRGISFTVDTRQPSIVTGMAVTSD